MHHRLIQTVLLFLCLVMFSAILSACGITVDAAKVPTAEKGNIDLSQWDFQRDGPVRLNGTWEFFWRSHQDPGRLTQHPPGDGSAYVQVPGVWNDGDENGEKYPGDGFATYRLRVKTGAKSATLALKFLDMATAFRVYVNETMVASVGNPGKTDQETVPMYQPGVVQIDPPSRTFDLIVHVSNFHHWLGGAWEPLLMGHSDDLAEIRERQLVISSVLFGTIVIMGLYHFGLFWTRRQERSSLYFGLFCFMIALRIIAHKERYLVTMFPAMEYQTLVRIVYISFYGCVPFFVLYVRSVFPAIVHGKVARWVTGISLVFILVVLGTDTRWFSRTLPVYQVLTLLLLVYGVWVIVRAIRHRHYGAVVYTMGFLVLLVTTVNDILFARMIISTGYWVPYGLFFFIFSQAFLISRQYTMAFTTIERQGDMLRQQVLEKQEIANSLEKSEARYRQMVEELPIPVGEYDFNLNILYANQAARDCFGYTLADLDTGVSGLALIPDEWHAKLAMRLQQLKEGRNPGPLELDLLRKDGTRIWGQIFPSFIMREGEPVGIRTCFMDLAERKRAEEALVFAAEQDKLALVGQVAGKMAHDFNNILGAIMGNAEFAALDCGEAETRKILNIILEQTRRGKILTGNLVAFAKDQELNEAFFNLNAKVELVLNLMRKELEGILVNCRLSDDIPQLLADPGMIEHALVNMIQNAVHALSKTADPEIAITTYTRHETVFLEIADNGCGIPEDFQDNIYDPAFTLKGSRDSQDAYLPEIKGTGYGMSNVKKYINKHNGTIEFVSSPDKGTRFTISLPVIHKELTAIEKKSLDRVSIVTQKKILVVEDEPAISSVLSRILSSEPFFHSVRCTHNYQTAMDAVSSQSFDLISLDYILGEKRTGMDIYRGVRPDNPKTPIIFVSGNIGFLKSMEGLKAKDPFVDHLSKPCPNLEYANKVNQWLM